MVLPRLLLFWLSDTVTELLQRASKPRMPPTQSPSTHTCSGGNNTHVNTHTRTHRVPDTEAHARTDLAVERLSFQRPDEVTVHLIGS